MVLTEIQTKTKSDLGVRTASAVVMIALGGSALWLGGVAFNLLLGVIALGLAYECWHLATKLTPLQSRRMAFFLVMLLYIGLAIWGLLQARNRDYGFATVAIVCCTVIATDVGAYFAGRNIGGPKIAPKISPNKTWAGLVGGMIAAGLVSLGGWYWLMYSTGNIDLIDGQYVRLFLQGLFIAVVAQAGDFVESWIKRKARVKDSGKLIPGHGGLFDRLDGYLPIFAISGIASLGSVIRELPI
jgi:phosphatidate cytidylyltransferase